MLANQDPSVLLVRKHLSPKSLTFLGILLETP